MRTYNHVYQGKTYIHEFFTDIDIEDSERVLVRVHTSSHDTDEIADILGNIRKYLKKAQIVGCSTQFIIREGKVIEDACLISVTVFEEGEMFSGRVPVVHEDGRLCTGEEVAEQFLKQIPDDGKAGFALLFFPQLYSRIEAFVNAVNEDKRTIVMLGGTAAAVDETGNLAPECSFAIENDSASNEEMVFVYGWNDRLKGYWDYACGVESVGIKEPISCDGTIINEVNGESAAEWYAGMLGKDALEADPGIAEAFPLVMQDERELSYHVAYNTDESGGRFLQTFPELESGSLVSPGYFNPQKIYEQVADIIEAIQKTPTETIFLYDCHARSALLADCAKWEIGHYASTNASGCLLAGEITCRNGINFYANYTFVVSALSENDNAFMPIEKPDLSSVQLLQEDNLHTLNVLLNNSNKRWNKEFHSKRERIEDAVFFNPAIGIDNQLKFQHDISEEKLNKVTVFYLNNEKMMRLFCGVTETYSFLCEAYQKMQSNFAGEGLLCYSYQDTSLLVAASDKIDADKFETTMDNIQEFLNSMVYEDIQLSYTAVTFFGTNDPITQLELALEYAKEHKLARVRYDEVAGNLEAEHENIHMLWVLREALVHNRIKPYFQEIHANVPGKRRLFEALMRITDENGKVYFPDQFLPIAKKYSLYDKLSEMMVKTVMDMFAERDARVSLNLSVQDIYNRQMLSEIFTHLKQAPNPNNYVFEIVESEEVSDYEYIKNFAERIHELGSKVAIDDFGSGYSNLIHLLRLDADYIKIDGEVIKVINSDPLCYEFLDFMHTWTSKKGQALICEYVENEEIQHIMEDMGVTYSQGYYYSKPHPWGPEDEQERPSNWTVDSQ